MIRGVEDLRDDQRGGCGPVEGKGTERDDGMACTCRAAPTLGPVAGVEMVGALDRGEEFGNPVDVGVGIEAGREGDGEGGAQADQDPVSGVHDDPARSGQGERIDGRARVEWE